MKDFFKKIIPASWLSFYHKSLAVLAAFFYRYPSEQLVVIGITGTKGKSTTSNIIWHLLEAAGYKAGLTSTANFRIHDREIINKQKMTMLGRFKLQKIIKEMVMAKCQYAVIETSSEGIKQWRHYGINYDVAIFLNLFPEHIESHGSYENYKKAKGELFNSLTKKEKKLKFRKTIIANKDDAEAGYFLGFPAAVKITYGTKEGADLVAYNIQTNETGLTWKINNTSFYLKQIGVFNIYNVLPAVALGINMGLSLAQISEYLASFPGMPGRMELIDAGQNFKVIVDYCYEPRSMENVLQTIQELFIKPELGNKIICVFGSCGGGRDTWRWPVMGEVAAKYAKISIITTDEPYDTDPDFIAEAIIVGLKKQNKTANQDYYKILNRYEAIKKAFALAKQDDVVLLAGLGSSTMIAVAKGKKMPWDDRVVARELLNT